MEVLVTGAAGFIGSHVRDAFTAGGHRVREFDVAYTGADIQNAGRVQAAVEGCDVVAHLASVGDVHAANADPFAAAAVNIGGTVRVVDAAARVGAHVLVASSWEVYGADLRRADERSVCQPGHAYGAIKYAAERIGAVHAERLGVPYTALRLGTAYGPRARANSVVSIFRERAARGEPLIVEGGGKQTRQFTHAHDLARGFVLAAELAALGVYNLVADEQVAVVEVAVLIADHYGVEYVVNDEGREHDAPAALYIDSDRASTRFGWRKSVTFRDGLAALLDESTV